MMRTFSSAVMLKVYPAKFTADLRTPYCWPPAAGLTGRPAARASRSMSPDQSMSAGTSTGRRNSGRSGPVASDQAKSSAYKGVSWHKHSQKWYAYIQSGGKMRGLGYFDSQADAAEAYDTEARKASSSAHPSCATIMIHKGAVNVIAAGNAESLL